jgi:hypothetical protein
MPKTRSISLLMMLLILVSVVGHSLQAGDRLKQNNALGTPGQTSGISSWGSQVTVASATNDRRSPSLACDDQNNLYVAFETQSPAHALLWLQVYRSTDLGLTWAAWGNASVWDTLSVVARPSLTYANGYMFLSYVRMASHDPRFARFPVQTGTADLSGVLPASGIGGQRVGTRVRICSNAETYFPTGATLYACYLVDQNDGTQAIYFTRSLDNGVTWSNEQLRGYVPSVAPFLPPDVGMEWGTPAGLFICYVGTGVNAYKILAQRSVDNGATFSSPVVIDTVHAGKLKLGPSVAVKGTSVLAAYEEEYVAGDYDVNFCYSTDNGTTWSRDGFQQRGVNELLPWVSHDNAGNFYLTFVNGTSVYGAVGPGSQLSTNASIISSSQVPSDGDFTAIRGLTGGTSVAGASAVWVASNGTANNLYGNSYSFPYQPPAAPAATAASSIGTSGFTANWSAVNGVTGYRLDVATDSGVSSFVSGYNNLDAGNVTSYTVGGLSSITSYYYRVRAVAAGGTSGNSNTVTATTLSLPPTALAGSNTSTSGFTANWSPMSGALSYRLDVATDNGFNSFVSGYNSRDVANVTSYAIGGLSSNTSYYYRVRVVTAGGTSASSNVIAVSTTAPGIPAAIAASSISTTGFTANWSAVNAATGYRLDVATDIGFSSFVSGYNNLDVGNVTSYAVGGLSANVSYYYRVRAVLAGGTSASSNIMTVSTLPPPPTPLAGSNISTTGFTANWSAVSGATSYRLDVATDNGFNSFVSGYNNLNASNATNYAVGGLTPNTIYYYCVRAVATGGTSASSNTITVRTTEARPPLITVTSGAAATAGQAFTVTAQITGNSGVASATMYHRKGGESGITTVSMTGSGGSYQATIPASAVTSSGVDYYINAADTYGNVGRYPATGWSGVEVAVTGDGLVKGTSQPTGSDQTAYRLVSIPIRADRNDVGSVLGDDLGGYDNTKWRMYELKADQTYAECSSSTPMTPGKAFWLIVRDGGTIDTGPGILVSASSRFLIPLNAGWTLVGNPFNFPIPIASLSLRGGTSQALLRSFTGSWNSPPSSITTMEPFTGYAVNSTASDTLVVNPDLTVGTLPRRRSASPPFEWGIAILAECASARDEDNLALVASEAKADRDVLDYPEPPTIGEYLSLSFPHQGEDGVLSRYCWDARPTPAVGEQWTVEVRSNIHDVVRLKLRGVEQVPDRFEIWLVDDLLKTVTDVRRTPVYSFVNAVESPPRRLTLLVGTRDYVQHSFAEKQIIPATFELSQNFPNPFNPVTTIRFGLPAASRVRLSVYSLLGQEVKTLVDGTRPAGYHTAVFDGTGLASGVYLYKIQTSGMDETENRYAESKKLLMLK